MRLGVEALARAAYEAFRDAHGGKVTDVLGFKTSMKYWADLTTMERDAWRAVVECISESFHTETITEQDWIRYKEWREQTLGDV